jgi:hypothetical protein
VKRGPRPVVQWLTLAGALALLPTGPAGAAAIGALNNGLAAAYPGVLLMAGTMFDEGLCLKPNWERAERLYLRAQKAGHRGGRLRLIAGLAAPGSDPAAALWWAQQENGPLPSPCPVPEMAAFDAERFVAELKLSSPQRVAACASPPA